ncbi:hypothetical protein [Hyalangium minutum]|uniref:Lipoprotein n=1 Tax=Hyalangium minutum TaxID=394096 RepID=A0A085WFQ4_9BACT|nr:hypothetical protein [Hyalangium minutum]KFE66517.1 hypothetical protein DB31_0990 [Hyalangium minutum]
MKSVQALVLTTLLSALLAVPASAKEKKSTGSAKTSSSGKSGGRQGTWMERSDAKGYTIKMPADATEKRDEWTTTYVATLPPDAALIKTSVSVEMLDEFTAVTNLDKAVEAVLAARPRGMQASISEQKELPNGYLVVIGPEYDTYAVDVIRNGKEVQVKAHCTGPSSRLDELKELCLSVKPTK